MSKRLQILTNSLQKKEQELQNRLDAHFADVKSANGQPLNDKRNGRATTNRWDTQRQAIRNLAESIEQTKRAMEREKEKIEDVEDAKSNFPQIILDMIESGEIKQWRRFPNYFFVTGVDKARFKYLGNNKIAYAYLDEISEEHFPKFRDTYNKIIVELNKLNNQKQSPGQTPSL